MTEQDKELFAAECNRRREEGLVLQGPGTYDIRDQIKAAGGIWDGRRKAWLMPDGGALAEMRKLAAQGAEQRAAEFRRKTACAQCIDDGCYNKPRYCHCSCHGARRPQRRF